MSKEIAYRAVRTALHRGELSRPSGCQKCGVIPSPTADGRAAIQAHHDDHTKPLDVEWLCAKCHRAVTPFPEDPGRPNYGEENGFSKLTWAQVDEIRASPLGCRKLSRAYGVDKKTIQRCRNGTQWRVR